MQSLIFVLVHCGLEQRHKTREQSWRRFASSYERNMVAPLPVLRQEKQIKPHGILFLS